MPIPEITLYELGPTRSARCHWMLAEAGLEYESVGNTPEFIGSDALKEIHPLGKLPAALINGKALFESAAITTAIADLVPEQGFIAPSGTWLRALHDQWVSFALTEMEPWVSTAELNTSDFVLPVEQHVAQIVPQCEMWYRRSAAVLNAALAENSYLVGDRFSATDIIVGYTVCWGEEAGWLSGQPHVEAYLDRLRERPHCTLPLN